MTKSSEAASPGGFEWFAFPADGGNPLATGAGDALRAAGLELGFPILTAGDRVLFGVLSRSGNSAPAYVWHAAPSTHQHQCHGHYGAGSRKRVQQRLHDSSFSCHRSTHWGCPEAHPRWTIQAVLLTLAFALDLLF